ncbi:MAG: hypothetical protein KGI90_15225 [Burkholderiales bacterium]|nr:hypothetical protein [Burkholderiales bacterium]MDE2277212.1 hypothetical protein [Burkholderiales bacterium]
MPLRRLADAARAALACAAAACVLGWPGPAAAQADSKPIGAIYTCTDDHGRRLTSDRPIIECMAKEQQVLNRDGSLKAVQPPALTADELAAKEARDRAAALARAAQADAVRRDRNLLARYPNEEAHERAREAALDTVRLAMKATAARLHELAAERKPLRDEAEFYVGKPLPLKLRAAIDANDAAAAAQREAAATQQAELDRINKLYDAELAHLRKLWAGATPGSLGTLGAAAPHAAQVGR